MVIVARVASDKLHYLDHNQVGNEMFVSSIGVETVMCVVLVRDFISSTILPRKMAASGSGSYAHC